MAQFGAGGGLPSLGKTDGQTMFGGGQQQNTQPTATLNLGGANNSGGGLFGNN